MLTWEIHTSKELLREAVAAFADGWEDYGQQCPSQRLAAGETGPTRGLGCPTAYHDACCMHAAKKIRTGDPGFMCLKVKIQVHGLNSSKMQLLANT
jgi:hypothetical protein